ncbi:MAG: hypothetical protein Kow0010_24020 [Dehalococcoidia bacterium]
MTGPPQVSAAEAYAARVDAINEQRRRFGRDRARKDRWAERAADFRQNPRRTPDPNLQALLELIHPGDVVVDVGGGAGRNGLPIALRCREVINVDPSEAMVAYFLDAAAEAGIANVRVVEADWLSAEGVEGDVVLAANVTYFVRDIVPFVEKLERAARRLVIIDIWSVPPPARVAGLFALLNDEPQVRAPGYRELLPVLWEMDILPDVRVLPAPFRGGRDYPQSRDEAIDFALSQVATLDAARARQRIEAEFDRLYERGAEGYRPLWRPDARELLITWKPRRR